MYGLDIPEKIIASVLCASRVEGDNPLSINIVGNAGIGKTQLIRQFVKNRGIRETADVSQKNLRWADGTIMKMIRTGELRHIIIPDFIAIMGHKYETVFATITALNSLIEEGLASNDFYGSEMNSEYPMYLGVITSMTFSKFEELFARFHTTGFFSRFLNLSWSYSPTTQEQIKHRIIEGTNDYKQMALPQLSGLYKFKEISTAIKASLYTLSDSLSIQQRDFYVISRHSGYEHAYGLMEGSEYRLTKQLLKLLKGIAIYEHPDIKTDMEIEKRDMDLLESFLPYMGFKRYVDIIKI